MNSEIQKISSARTIKTFLTSDKACSGTLCSVINKAYGHRLNDEERAAMPFAGGIMQYGYQCGMIWGAALSAGAQAYHLFGAGSHAEANAVIASQRLVESFEKCSKHVNCFEITDIDNSSSTMKMITYFVLKGGTIHCCLLAAKYAPIAFNEINIALTGEKNEFSQKQVSCSSMLAKKLGLTDIHIVMVAGFAGGLGLCGGFCGALGAAIWFIGLQDIKGGKEKINFKNLKALNIIDKFIKYTNYEFECSKIAGRKFIDVNDHADYICNGGCQEIIELLYNELLV